MDRVSKTAAGRRSPERASEATAPRAKKKGTASTMCCFPVECLAPCSRGGRRGGERRALPGGLNEGILPQRTHPEKCFVFVVNIDLNLCITRPLPPPPHPCASPSTSSACCSPCR